MAQEASKYHLPDWAVHKAMFAMESGFNVKIFTWGASLTEEKKAYEEVRALMGEIKSLMTGGVGPALAQLKQLGGKKWQQAQADWDNYLALVKSGYAGNMYKAGVLFGCYFCELLTTILLLLSVAGAAVRVARLAASGARALGELAGLVVEAEGTEIGTAAKTLVKANAELQSARAAGDAQRISQSERNVAAAARDLKQKGEAAQQALEQSAPNLVKESGRLKEAKGKAGGSGRGGGSASPGGSGTPKAAANPKSQPDARKPSSPTEEGDSSPAKTPKPTDQPLDWSRTSRRTGGDAADHVTRNHGQISLTKPQQGVFYSDPVATTNDAWAIAGRDGITPVSDGYADVYVVPRPNSGYAGGMGGQLSNLDNVTIITEHGTNTVITAYPSGGTPPFPKGYIPFSGNP